MKIRQSERYALMLGVALAISGCAGATTSFAPQTPSASAARFAPDRSGSWMAPEAQGEDLLYLSDTATNDVDVFSYPQGKLVGTLTGFGEPRSECVDAQGDVWIADLYAWDVIEYRHGGTQPVAALSTPGAPHGCSVDPKTGDIAVTGGVNHIVLAVWHRKPHGWRNPRFYTDSSIHTPAFCGFDDKGDLLLDGVDLAKSFRLAELPHLGTGLVNLSVTPHVVSPGQVQWDGKAVAVGDIGVSPSVIYRLAVSGSKATQIGSVKLDESKSVRQFWIQDATLVGPDYSAAVGLWKYPAGGSPLQRITSIRGYGAAVSLTSSSK